MFIVRAYDTDYGSDCSWKFSNKEDAEKFAWALRYDYGSECQACVKEVDVCSGHTRQ